MTRKHQLIWSNRYAQEHAAVMAECQRVTELGGSFEIVNKFNDGQWTSFFTLYYPEVTA